MIENLKGFHETVSYKDRKAFKLYDNDEFEAYPDHWHPELEIIMPIRGDYLVRIRDVEYRIKPDQIIIINSGVIHNLIPPEPGERLIFQPDNALLHLLPEMDNTMSMLPQALVLTEDNYGSILPALRQDLLDISSLYFSHNPLSETQMYVKVLDMFLLIGREYYTQMPHMDGNFAKQNEHIEKMMTICSYLNEHCTEDLYLEDVATMAGFSKFHFSRIFKEYSGTTFYKYLNNKRIERAEKLLVDPSVPILEVALSCGFSSNSSFIRMFKQLKGCTPKDFRKMRT